MATNLATRNGVGGQSQWDGGMNPMQMPSGSDPTGMSANTNAGMGGVQVLDCEGMDHATGPGSMSGSRYTQMPRLSGTTGPDAFGGGPRSNRAAYAGQRLGSAAMYRRGRAPPTGMMNPMMQMGANLANDSEDDLGMGAPMRRRGRGSDPYYDMLGDGFSGHHGGSVRRRPSTRCCTVM